MPIIPAVIEVIGRMKAPGSALSQMCVKRDLAFSEGKEIPMEVIPIEVLKRWVEVCVSQCLGGNTAPEEVEIRSVSAPLEPSRGKDWGIEATYEWLSQ